MDVCAKSHGRTHLQRKWWFDAKKVMVWCKESDGLMQRKWWFDAKNRGLAAPWLKACHTYMTHCYVWHDSWGCVTWFIDTSVSHTWTDCLSADRAATQLYQIYLSYPYVWLIPNMLTCQPNMLTCPCVWDTCMNVDMWTEHVEHVDRSTCWPNMSRTLGHRWAHSNVYHDIFVKFDKFGALGRESVLEICQHRMITCVT